MRLGSFLRRHQRKIWIIPLVIGVLLIVQAARHRSLPSRKALADIAEPSTTVKVIRATLTDETPWIRGFGTVEPARVWHAVADVSGRVLEVHHSLKEGALVKKGDILVQIDDSSYRLSLQQHQSALAQASSSLEQLKIEEKNDKILLRTENQTMNLYKKDLMRYKKLLSDKAVSRSEVDRLERAMLVESQKVHNLKNSLATMPSKRSSLRAKINGLEAAVKRAKLDIEHCVIRSPYDGRISKLAVERSQFVTQGRELFQIEDNSKLEINVQIGLDRLNSLGLSHEGDDKSQAIVYYQGSRGKIFKWPAHFDRSYNRVDPKTRTAGIVVTVDETTSIDGNFKLVNGIYCEVHLMGSKAKNVIALPIETIQGEEVFVVASDDRLEPRRVEQIDGDGDICLVRSGLEEGDLVILSELGSPIPGMKLTPIMDKKPEEVQ